jgi:uncharacterized protein (DUF58 family)
MKQSMSAPSTISAAPVAQLRQRPGIFPSLTGIVYVLMMIFMGLAAMNLQANLLFGVFGLMLGIYIASGPISRSVLRKLRVNRILPEQAVVGAPVTLLYEFGNAKRFWPSFSVTLGEVDAAEAFVKRPVAYMLHAAPRTTATVPTEVIPKRRGAHVFDRYQLSTSFPFGFKRHMSYGRQHETLLVFPAIGQVDRKLLQLCKSADRSGATMRPRRGGDDEFYGVKEFRSGENPRSIYWRRSARTGVLVSKEMTQVSPPKLLILVDTFIQERSMAEHAAVEKTIAMAASLASHALAAGLMVGVYAWSGEWLGMNPNRGKRHRVDVLAQLAQLPLNMARDTQALVDASREFLPSGVTPVLLTPGETRAGMGEPRSGVIIISAVSPQSTQWFKFDKTVDFSESMPWNQRPPGEASPTGGKTESFAQKVLQKVIDP